MQALAPSFSVTADLHRKEVHFAVSGLWDMPTMLAFQSDLLAKSKPLFEKGEAIKALGDLRGFVTQTREISEMMRVVVVESARLGTVKTAIIADSMLATMQYKRLNEGINVEIFETKVDALTWLRS